MRILIFSDTHGQITRCIRVIESIGTSNIDAVIHAGDYAQDCFKLRDKYEQYFPVHGVRGNNDFASIPNDLFIELGGKRFYITHGHQYRVKWEPNYHTLAEHAEALGADIAVFGHTHAPYSGIYHNVRLINPGSMTYTATYAVAEIEDGILRTSVLDV